MTTTPFQQTAIELWGVLKKEITGVQLLWEALERVYFKPQGKGFAALETDMPLLFRLAQTVLMESLLMRVSRLMEHDAIGKYTNLSLSQLVKSNTSLDGDEQAVLTVWNSSQLKWVRDKYLSHNDLDRSLTTAHTLNIPLETADIEAMRALVSVLRDLRRKVHRKLIAGVAYLDEGLDLQIRHDVDVLSRSLLGSQLFFELLPDHSVLQQAWQESGHG